MHHDHYHEKHRKELNGSTVNSIMKNITVSIPANKAPPGPQRRRAALLRQAPLVVHPTALPSGSTTRPHKHNKHPPVASFAAQQRHAPSTAVEGSSNSIRLRKQREEWPLPPYRFRCCSSCTRSRHWTSPSILPSTTEALQLLLAPTPSDCPRNKTCTALGIIQVSHPPTRASAARHSSAG